MSCLTGDRCCAAPCIDGGICLLPHSHGGEHYSDKEVLLDFKNPARHEIAALKARAEKAEAERDAALSACAEMRAVLTEIREWRRAAVGLVPHPKADAETLGARIDAALLSRPDLGRGWASPEVVARVRDAAIKCGDCVLCQGTAERHDDGCPVAGLPW